MHGKIQGIVCVAILFVILTLGLWPFHSPKNNVSWLKNRNGLHFGKYGTVISSGPLGVASSQLQDHGSIEIWLQPRRKWDQHTFLSFYVPENLFQLSLRQAQTALELKTEDRHDPHHARRVNVHVEDVFRKPSPVFITITSGFKGTAVYINGIPAYTASQFRLFAKDFTGGMVLGDSPGQGDSWSGQVLGLAIYRRELTPAQVSENYRTWMQRRRPEVVADDRTVALYLFDERAGEVVHNKVRLGVDLYIPARYKVVNQIFLQSPWSEFSMSRNYWAAVLKNIIGFIPFGFCFYGYLSSALRIKRPALVTVVLGGFVSLTIEILQAYLPTRDSGTTDIITNTLGTWIGVALYNFACPILARVLPGWASVAPRVSSSRE